MQVNQEGELNLEARQGSLAVLPVAHLLQIPAEWVVPPWGEEVRVLVRILEHLNQHQTQQQSTRQAIQQPVVAAAEAPFPSVCLPSYWLE